MAGTTLETSPAADDLKAHACRLFYFYMAAGKTLKVKLRYRSRPSISDLATEDESRIKELIMASAPEHIQQPEMQPALEPFSASYEQGNPSSIPPPHMMQPLTASAILSQRRRRKSSTALKRSASTPNVRGSMNMNIDSGMTLAEKRRNKLGYHRTSVACGTQTFLINPLPITAKITWNRSLSKT